MCTMPEEYEEYVEYVKPIEEKIKNGEKVPFEVGDFNKFKFKQRVLEEADKCIKANGN